MIRLLIGIIFVFMAVLSLEAGSTYKNIVVLSYANQEDADYALKRIRFFLEESKEISSLKEENEFEYISRTSGKYFIITIEPFRNDKVMNKVLSYIQKKYPDAFVYTHWGEETSKTPEVIEKEVVVIKRVFVEVPKEVVVVKKVLVESEEDNMLLWLALVALAFVGIILIFRSSRQTEKIDEARSEIQKSRKKNEELLVNVSEKIQDPINEIIERSEKIIEGGLNAVQSQELENIRYSDELLLDITNDLIDFLKLQSGKLEIQSAAFNINNVLDEVAGMVSAKSRGSKVDFVFDVASDVPAKVIGDPLRLSQLLTNLLSNAMRFTDNGEVKLIVERLENKNSHAILRFSIIDTGVGIREDRMDDIFEPFSSANDKSQTGMGLFISKKLTQMMGGDIEVKSKVGRGTTFVVTVALSMKNLDEKRHYRLPSKSYTGHLILIIDNHTSSAESLKKMLEYFRHKVEIKSSSEIDADSSIISEYEIIIVSKELLKSKLLETLESIKKEQHIKIVSVGNMLSLSRVMKSNSGLIDRQIMKPFSQQRVMELVINLFEDQVSIDKDFRSNVLKEKKEKESLKKEVKIYDDIPITEGIKRTDFVKFAGSTILIAEDNLINQKVLTGLLGSSGISLNIAGDGQEALNKLEHLKTVDLILMDINMPVMDGYEATRRIRSNSQFKDIPVVSLTGLGLPEEIEKMYELGMNAHLIKPLQIGALYTIFTRYLDVQSGEVDTIPKDKDRVVFTNNRVVSFQDGFNRASRDEELYIEILTEFTDLYRNSAVNLREMIMNDNIEQAKKLSLDIRGVAANIGAESLSETARQLQGVLSRGEEKDLIGLTKVFKIQIEEVFVAIETLLKKN